MQDTITPDPAGDPERTVAVRRVPEGRGAHTAADLDEALAAYLMEPPGLTAAEAVRVAVAEEWQPRVDALRELLDEVGVLAANAPEDDAFAVCEDIAMRIAAHGVPDDGRHPDGCTCQFCREDEREEAARLDREDIEDLDDGGPTSQLAQGDWDDAVSEATS